MHGRTGEWVSLLGNYRFTGKGIEVIKSTKDYLLPYPESVFLGIISHTAQFFFNSQ
jgi:hypothetical protein